MDPSSSSSSLGICPPLPPLRRDPKGSLEVFGSTPPPGLVQDRANPLAFVGRSLMAFPQREASECYCLGKTTAEQQRSNETDWPLRKLGRLPPAAIPDKLLSDSRMAARAAEWGLVVKSGTESGEPQVMASSKAALRESSQLLELPLPTKEKGDPAPKEVDARSGDALLCSSVSDSLRNALDTLQQTFVVSDATRKNYPIVFASAGFFEMTGYTSRDVIGRNCRFLQGPGTDPTDIARIREALVQGKTFCGRILNYKKDGSPFWNLLTISSIKDETGNVVKFIGMQVEVSKYTEGYKHKALRPNGLPESLIRYDARQKDRAAMDVMEIVQAVKYPQSANTSNDYEMSPMRVDMSLPLTPLQSPIKFSTGNSYLNGVKAVPSRSSDAPDPVLSISEAISKQHPSSIARSFRFGKGHSHLQKMQEIVEPEILMTRDETPQIVNDTGRLKELRKGMDLATTLERIEKNFVITDPRLPDNPIIYASDRFLELTEYTREEILGKNCRFLQGPDTNQESIKRIRDAIRYLREATIQLLNYTKSGKPFWNIFHLKPMYDQKGELQYFIGVQLDASERINPIEKRLSEKKETEGAQRVTAIAADVNEALRELPDANLRPDDLWVKHSEPVDPKPHKMHNDSWKAIRKICETGERIELQHFRLVKPLGFGGTGSVHLVELKETGEYFALKSMDKLALLDRNKVHRAMIEREILGMIDHPFVPTLYASFQTNTHLCLVTDFCSGGELFELLDRQPQKVFPEAAARFYLAEVLIALEYLHCQGVIYRDLKLENVLLQQDGHIVLTDYDLSFLTTCQPQLVRPGIPLGKTRKREIAQPMFFRAEPQTSCNSFVGTGEYIAPEVIIGAGHSSAVDWWAVGILLYEMLYGHTPFQGKNRRKTFANILHKDLTFPSSIPVSLAARKLIHALLQRNPSKRIGSAQGAYEIKEHPFFEDIKWPLIRNMTPPPLEEPLVLIGKTSEQDNASNMHWGEFNGISPFVPNVIQ